METCLNNRITCWTFASSRENRGSNPPRSHDSLSINLTFRGGNASLVANSDWAAYTKPGGARVLCVLKKRKMSLTFEQSYGGFLSLRP